MLVRIVFGTLFLHFVHLAFSQVPIRNAYSETFNMAEGLEHSVIADLITDRNDLVWIAVRGTLQLFDGDRFVDMGHLIHSSNSSGNFGFENGKDIFLLKEHILYKFTTAQYTSINAPKLTFPVYSHRGPVPKIIYEDCCNLFLSHPNDSLYQIEKESFRLIRVYNLTHQPHPTNRWSSIYVSPIPVTTVPYFDSNYLRVNFDLITENTRIDYACPKVGRGALASGDSMLVLRPDRLEIYTKGGKQSVTLPDLGNEFAGDFFRLAGRDSVYIALRNAIYLFNLRTLKWISKIQPTGGVSILDFSVRKMLLSRPGNLYFTTFNSGLVKMYPPNEGFQYLGIQGNKKYFIKCIRVSEKNNLVLAGTLKDGLLVFDTSGVLKHQILNLSDTQSYQLISAILKITESRYILLSEKTYDLTFHDDQYTIRELDDFNSNWLAYYDTAIEDYRNGRYFIFNHDQLVEVRPDNPVSFRYIDQLNMGSSISVTQSGGMYVMSGLDELVFFNQALQPYSIKFNVPNFGFSRCLVPYLPGQFLVATDLGLFLLDTLRPEIPVSPIFNHMVYAILPGSKEREFWFSTDYGLYRLDADFHFKRFAIESGLQENEYNTNSCYKTESGKLYFGGVNGITAFYPDHVQEEEDTPETYISILSVNGVVRERYIAAGKSPAISLDYDENVIRIRLLGKGRRSPRNYNFQYRIKELHKEWIDMGRSMDIQLQLTPGHNTISFHISDIFEPHAIPRNELQLHIKPPLYRRWWFIVAFSLLPLYLLYYFMNLRRKRLAMKLAYVQELEKQLHEERLRISRELHDNIGAQMATVKRSINFMIEHSDRLSTEQNKSKMNDLESISSQINQELRDTIWAVQNEHMDVAGFFTRLKSYVFQMVGPDSLLRVTYMPIGNMNILLGPFTALNLHRICQEAINNIIKHAEATEVHIQVESSDRILTIVIADNGKGYDLNEVQEGYGLGNIRKRAEQIGAFVAFNSTLGSGSSIRIEYTPHLLTSDKKIIHG